MDELPGSVEAAADLLYGRPPGEFVAARDELANSLRAAGRTAIAREVKRLRRPTMSAWALNLIARREPERLAELLALGPAIGRAQRLGRLDELRTLADRRAEHVAALIRAARAALSEAGHQMSSDIALDIETTLAGALADGDVAERVRAGRLDRPIEYAGLGPAPVLRLVPSAPGEEAAPGEPEAEAEADRGAEQPEQAVVRHVELPDLDKLEKDYDDAHARHAQAIATADRIDDERAALRAEYDRLREQLRDLEARLRDSDRSANEALREIGRADRDLQRARQALDKAREVHARARRQGG